MDPCPWALCSPPFPSLEYLVCSMPVSPSYTHINNHISPSYSVAGRVDKEMHPSLTNIPERAQARRCADEQRGWHAAEWLREEPSWWKWRYKTKTKTELSPVDTVSSLPFCKIQIHPHRAGEKHTQRYKQIQIQTDTHMRVIESSASKKKNSPINVWLPTYYWQRHTLA